MSSSAPVSEADPSDRKRRLRNLSEAVGSGLYEEMRQKKDRLRIDLSQDFVREITIAERCVYHSDFEEALHHGLLADMIHRTLESMEQW